MKKTVWIVSILCMLFVGCTSMPYTNSRQEAAMDMTESIEQNAESINPCRGSSSPVAADESASSEDKPEVGIGPMYGENEKESHLDKYVKSSHYHKNKDLIAPFFLFESADAKKVNKEIESWILDLAEESKDSNPIYTTYSSIYHAGILSTVIQIDRNGEISFLTYNFDAQNGNQVGLDTVLAKVGLDWEMAKNIFWRDRIAFWKGLRSIYPKQGSQYREKAEAEIGLLQEMYEQNSLPFLLDEDGLMNFILNLSDKNANYYWQMYCISPNRTERLQRNAYSIEFPMVVIPAPREEELSNINIVKKIVIEGKTENKKKHFLLLPLWESLNFSWQQSKEREDAELDRNSWQRNNLSIGEAISIEMDPEMKNRDALATIRLGEMEAVFSPNEYFFENYNTEDIIYMMFTEKR